MTRCQPHLCLRCTTRLRKKKCIVHAKMKDAHFLLVTLLGLCVYPLERFSSIHCALLSLTPKALSWIMHSHSICWDPASTHTEPEESPVSFADPESQTSLFWLRAVFHQWCSLSFMTQVTVDWWARNYSRPLWVTHRLISFVFSWSWNKERCDLKLSSQLLITTLPYVLNNMKYWEYVSRHALKLNQSWRRLLHHVSWLSVPESLEAESQQIGLRESPGLRAEHEERWWEAFSSGVPITGAGCRKPTRDKVLWQSLRKRVAWFDAAVLYEISKNQRLNRSSLNFANMRGTRYMQLNFEAKISRYEETILWRRRMQRSSLLIPLFLLECRFLSFNLSLGTIFP